MSLRVRLIVVFFLLSVVPVGAVTYYTYASNAQAIRDAARGEAEQLAVELSDRMRLTTAQLSQRVETLMELPEPPAQAAAAATPPQTRRVRAAEPASSRQAQRAPEPVATPAAPAPPAVSQYPTASELHRALGDLSVLVTNIEIRGQHPRRGPRPDGFLGGRRPGADATTPPDASTPDGAAVPDDARLRPNRPRGPGTGPGDRRGEPPGEGGAAPVDPNRLSIDLRGIRRELFEELVPDRAAFESMTPEERQRVLSLIEQRMQGVAQGIAVLQKELASRVPPAASTTAGTPSAGPTPPAAPTPPAPGTEPRQTVPAPTAAPPTPPRVTVLRAPLPEPQAAPQPQPAPAPPAPPPTRRSTSLSGRKLAVKVEREGKVVGQVDAEVDLPKLLTTVFAATPRDRGELPFAVGEGGELYAPSPLDRQRLEALPTAAVKPAAATATTVLDDWIVATTPDPTGSRLRFGVARPVGEALRELEATSARNAALGLCFIGLALIVIVPLSGRLTRNLDTLSGAVHRIAAGDYSARVPVRSRDEVGRLAVAFNQMAADVEAHQRSAVTQERLRRELELGRQIQHDMLPQAPLLLGLTEIKGVSVPAREVGGDFFNYFALRDETIALVVGDVSGKGVGAALLMANLQAALRTRLSLGQDLAALAQELDVEIDRTTPGPVYSTLFVGILDPAARRLRFVNAGHNPQYVLGTGSGLRRMESTGRPIGLLSGGGYVERQVDVSAGDVLFFYTDGCVEAENTAGEQFGADRLERLLGASADRGADAVIAAVETEIDAFRAGAELTDDATIMVVKVG